MEVLINAFCFLFGVLTGIVFRGNFTINYRHTYRDDTTQFQPSKETFGFNTEPDKKEEVDSPAEIAEKIQEVLGVFIDDEQERN
jgi:hypothetical protein